jgi:purine-binding chemotaxis protein CheW
MADETAKPGQFLSFTLSELSYALPIASVREINRLTTITPIPETPSYMAGVMNLRGKVIPIVDLRLRFGLPAAPYTRRTCIIVVDSEKGPAGLLVDSIDGVAHLTASQIEPRPEVAAHVQMSFVTGMGKLEKRVLILIDVTRVLTNAPIETLANAA